jgi:ABC-type glycerol-3-phosphate transport system permease component
MSTATVSVTTLRGSQKWNERFQAGLTHAVLVGGGVIVMIPLVWMLSTSLKAPHQVTKFPPIWIPNPVVFSNYVRAVTIFPVPFWFFIRNSLFLSLSNVVGSVLSNSIVAFAFARLRFRGSRILFFVVLSTMMLPQQVTMIPLFILFSKLGWVNTYKPLIIPQFFCNAYFIFLMRQFYATIPRELDDAAKMDGCSILGLFFRIMLPLAKPAIGIMAIFEFSGSWNWFLWPLIYLSKMETYPLAIALQQLRAAHGVLWSELMVVSFIAMLPPLVLFFIAQRSYIQGIVITGVKG